MINRDAVKELLNMSNEYPVVTIIGPRQSGKTTLAKMVFPNHKYVSVEEPDIRERAINDPRNFLSSFSPPVIIDEIQRVPSLISYIQGVVDNGTKEGSFILTGSHQPSLNEAISQSLAGRTAILTLLPLSVKELIDSGNFLDTWDFILKGGYPKIYDKDLKLSRFFSGYVQTYVERDVRQMLKIKDAMVFQQFIKLLAGRTGSLLNNSSLSNDIGVSSQTIKEWLSVLEASFISYRLPPFFRNISKRVVKTPKLYFQDTGLASFLLGIYSPEILSRDPLRGMLFENGVINEIIKQKNASGSMSDLYFYRDNHGNEVDLCIESGRKLYLVEIKSSETFTSRFTKGLRCLSDILKDDVSGAYVFYNGKEKFKMDGIDVLNPFIHGIPEEILLP